jgi:hypothetical protein
VDEQRESFARRSWKWIAGAVLAGVATVIGGYVVKANDWFVHRVHPEPALTAVVRSAEVPPDVGWFFPTSPAKLRPPSLNDELSVAAENAWVQRNGGLPSSGYYVKVVLQATSGKTVVIDQVRAEVTRRAPAPTGTWLDRRACGEELVPALFQANLDASPVTVKPVAGTDEAGKPIAPKPLPRTISNSNPDVWVISGVTSKSDAEWVAFIDYTADGKAGTIRVDDHGKPFRTVALDKATGARPVFGESGSPDRWELRPKPRSPIC